jgi:hypothetical protein
LHGQPGRGIDRDDLVVVTVQDERRHVDSPRTRKTKDIPDKQN